MSNTVFTFQDQLSMSEDERVEKLLHKRFPTAVMLERANLSDDRMGTDWWVTLPSGQRISIDVKVRVRDYDDYALETWSVVGQKIGWTRDPMKRTDYVMWVWLETGRNAIVPFLPLRGVFVRNWQEWRKRYRVETQETRDENGWKSECVFVPRIVVWSEIYRSYGGNPKNQETA